MYQVKIDDEKISAYNLSIKYLDELAENSQLKITKLLT